MPPFADFFTWLATKLSGFIFTKVTVVAGALSPAIVTMATMYVMFWGYLHLTGKIEEPILEGAKRIFILAAILVFSIGLASNLPIAMDIFVNGPQALGAVLLAAPNPVTAVDQIWLDGNAMAQGLAAQGGALSLSGLGFYLSALLVYLCVGIACVYTAFLLALSQIALAILLALGPLFVAMLFFDATKRFFESWIAQLANYSLIIILVSTVAALLLTFLRDYSTDGAALGGGITIAAAVRVCIVAVLIFLIMRQVPAMAAGLASGIALSTFGAVSKAMAWGLGGARNFGRGMWDSATKAGTARYDPLSRKGGHALGQGARATAAAAWRLVRRPNTVKPK